MMLDLFAQGLSWRRLLPSTGEKSARWVRPACATVDLAAATKPSPPGRRTEPHRHRARRRSHSVHARGPPVEEPRHSRAAALSHRPASAKPVHQTRLRILPPHVAQIDIALRYAKARPMPPRPAAVRN